MPYCAPKPCPRHPEVLLNRKEICPLCPKPAHTWETDKKRGNRHDRGYGSKWDSIRKAILERDSYICLVCRKNKATQVDHIVPKSKGGSSQYSNLQSICAACHRHKTATDKHYIHT